MIVSRVETTLLCLVPMPTNSFYSEWRYRVYNILYTELHVPLILCIHPPAEVLPDYIVCRVHTSLGSHRHTMMAQSCPSDCRRTAVELIGPLYSLWYTHSEVSIRYTLPQRFPLVSHAPNIYILQGRPRRVAHYWPIRLLSVTVYTPVLYILLPLNYNLLPAICWCVYTT